ncbi:hypothetical protein JR064_11650 [Xanthomonas sp. CFBP 8703]|uniref:Uncharacterized protein n=1 Tax=Xanthomonas bonasiae TaxID=2810351 RepID=A0ABS3B2G3_9XANT|nr:hypothetical protein [Xanthomonas bonasiae]MBN6102823.1 hypothetical protein [Xanthomonas bonasiae]
MAFLLGGARGIEPLTACEALDRAREVDVADARRLRLVETLSADCLRCLNGRVAVSWQSGDPMDTVSTIV